MIKVKITSYGGYVMGSGDLPEGITEEQVMNKIMEEVYKKQQDEIFLADDDEDYDDDDEDYDDEDYDDEDYDDEDYDDEEYAGYQVDPDLERKEGILWGEGSWKDIVKEKLADTETEVFESMEDFLEL